MGSGRDEAEEEGRPQSTQGLADHGEEFGFYPGGTRELPEGSFQGCGAWVEAGHDRDARRPIGTALRSFREDAG